MAEILVDSYSESNQDSEYDLGSAEYYWDTATYQSFTAISGNLSSCKFYLKKVVSPTGNAVAKLYAHSGPYGEDSIPTGEPLAISDNFNVADLTEDFQLVTFTFTGANQYTLIDSTHYCIVVEYSGGDYDNYIAAGIDTSPTHSGNSGYCYDATWYSDWTDLCFYVYCEEAGGEDIIKVINEIMNIGESRNYLPGRTKVINESINVAESQNYTRGRFRVINEVLNISETKNYKRTLLRIVNETLHISELKNKLMVLIRIKNEIINIGESTFKFIGGQIIKVINEVINISEAKNRLLNRIRVINESINISELKNKVSGIIRVKNEVINLSETKNYIRGRLRIINEIINISEVKNKLRILIRIKNEVVNIGETKNKLMTLLRIKNETINIGELKNTAKKIIRVINETIHITENIVKKIWIIIIQFPRNLKRIIILIRDRK